MSQVDHRASLLTPSGTRGLSVGAFDVLVVAAALIAFAGTTALVACAWLLGQRQPVTRTQCTVLGAVMAMLGYVPFMYLNWSSSGPDSGPPVESFLGYAIREVRDPFVLLFVAAGLVTAFFYAMLAPRSEPRGD